ncbi:MAG: cytochrome c biogenesis protein ResB [Bacteroidaceae bacterium]|nr:cytochrome c biogenesis protein ResB [Bacteroidaceae bacterium]
MLIVAMAVGTFVERASGHEVATATVYYAPWFLGLWGALVVAGVVVVVRWHLWRRFWVFMLHVSLLLVLCGAGISFFTSRQGTLHLRQGSKANYFFPSDSDLASPLPFSLRLDTFIVSLTPGTNTPRDFASRVTVFPSVADTFSADIAMNRILTRSGFRFYQTSYDNDLRGTILTVKYDPYGLPLTYAAYALLGLSMMAVLIGRFCRRNADRQTALNRTT